MNVPSNIEVPRAPSAQHGGRSLAGVDRVGVLVLGMHRSGTSALTRMLNLLGCSLPRNLLGGNDTNPTGHWESSAAMVLNDELLAKAGSAWDDWTALAEGFFTAPGYPELVARGAALLRAEFDNAPLFVFKDPRNCRLARFWLDVFAAESIHPFVVIPLRNPLEVAQSLKTRNHADEHYGPLLWLRHVLDAEAATRGRNRAFTSYEQMLDCWEVVAGRLQQDLGIAWPGMSPATQEEIGAFIDKRHRRENVTTEALLKNQLLSGWVRRTWGILHKWATDGEDAADYAELDAITRAFDEAAPAFARLILRGKHAQQQVSELEHTLAETQSRIADIEAQTAQQLDGQREALTHETAQALAECAALRGQIDELIRLRDAAEGHATELADNNAELRGLLEKAQARSEAVGGQLHEAAHRLEEHANRVEEEADRTAEQTNRVVELSNRLAELESALIQRREENEQIWRDVTLEQGISADLRSQLAEVSQREETQRQRLAEADAWVFRLAAERQAAQSAMMAARAAQLAAERAKKSAENELQRNTADIRSRLRDALAGKADAEAQLAERREELEQLIATSEHAARRAEAALADARRPIEDLESRLRVAQADKDHSEALLAERFQEIAHLAALLQAADARAQEAVNQHAEAVEASRIRHAELEQQVGSAQQGRIDADTARRDLTVAQDERGREIIKLTQLLRHREHEVSDRDAKIEWLRQTQVALSSTPQWWLLLSKVKRRKREQELLLRKQLFDGAAYLKRHPDVAAESADPLRHYILHGLVEGRELD